MLLAICTTVLAAAAGQDVKLGAYVSEIGGLAEPSAAVVLPDGSLAVLETSLDRVRFLALDGAERGALGGRGEAPGQFRGPASIALGPDLLWVADTGNHRVQAFDQEGEVAHVFGAFGAGAGELNAPMGLAADGRRVYVADTRNHRVQVFERDGSANSSFGSWGAADGEFDHPLDVAVDGDGNIYVADGDNHRIQKFDAAGTHVKSWGDFGPHPGFLATPTGIVHHGGLLFVADRDNHRIQVFDTGGERAYAWGLHALLPRESGGKLHYPRHVAVSADGRLAVVAEAFEDRLQLFGPTEDGAEPPAATLAERSTSTHYGPRVAAAGGLMVVVEPTRPGIKVFDIETDVAGLEPINITNVSSWGRRFGQMLLPWDAAVDPERGLLYVCDPALRKLEAWRIERDEGPIKYDPYMLKLAFSLDLARMLDAPIEPVALELDGAGDVWLLDAVGRGVVRLHWEQEPELERLCDGFVEPVDLASSPDGALLYVADLLAPAVVVVDRASGARVRAFTAGLVRPSGIAVDGEGFLYVSDAHHHAIFKLTGAGELVDRWGSKGLGRLEFFKPGGIALRTDGELIVMDDGNHRAQILSTQGEFLHAFGSRFFTRPTRAPTAERR